MGLEATAVLTFVVGLILASAVSATLVFAQASMPGKVGDVSKLFFGMDGPGDGVARFGPAPAPGCRFSSPRGAAMS